MAGRPEQPSNANGIPCNDLDLSQFLADIPSVVLCFLRYEPFMKVFHTCALSSSVASIF